MKIYYQGEPGAYSHRASLEVQNLLSVETDEIIGLADFDEVWKQVSQGNIGVIPIENSYAGNIHNNLYNFLKFESTIIGEYNLEVKHALLSKEKDISKVNKVYSHPQALSQCHKYLQSKKISPAAYYDTAGAARYVSESNEPGVGAIASEFSGEIYGLNVLDTFIQDEDKNTTRFFVITPKNLPVLYKKESGKITILFEARNIPSSLYKCLGAFATNGVNLTKIESIPSFGGQFSYFFWIDFEGHLHDESVEKALEELRYFTSFIKVLGEY